MIFPFRDNVPTERTPVVTYLLIALNVAAFLYEVRLPSERHQEFAYAHGFVPARIDQLSLRQPIVVLIDQGRQFQLEPVPSQVYASLVTTMFLHGGLFHLLSNMWFLWIFGDNVEDRLGRVSFACFYLSGGLLASLCHWWHDPTSTVPIIGASGAIAAVLGAYAVTFPWARIRSLVFLFVFVTIVELPALLVLGVWFLTQLAEARSRMGAEAGGVAWWAHIGGFLAGAIIMPLVRTDPDRSHLAEHDENQHAERDDYGAPEPPPEVGP